MTQPIHPLLERVARAIAPQAWCIGFSQTERDWSIAKARAAVQALMEPDEGMAMAGYRALLNEGDGGTYDAVLCLKAMLAPLIGEGE